MKKFLIISIIISILITPALAQELRYEGKAETTIKFGQEKAEIPEYCPDCNAKLKRIPIIYGEPTQETLKKAEKGEIILGGCLISKGDPNFLLACPECKKEIGRYFIKEEGLSEGDLIGFVIPGVSEEGLIGTIAPGMSEKELYEIFSSRQLNAYRERGAEKWLTFWDWTTPRKEDLITFHLKDGKVLDWRKGGQEAYKNSAD